MLSGRGSSSWLWVLPAVLVLAPGADAALPVFEEVGERHQLPEVGGSSVHQDHRGLVWITSEYGLFRWDGHEVISYQPDPADPDALPAAQLEEIAEDQRGNLWIRTRNAGLIRFDPASAEHRHYHSGEDGELESDYLAAVVRGPQGRIWFAYRGGGLGRIDPESGEVNALATEAGGEMGRNLALEAGDAALWLGTETGLFRVDPESARAEPLPLIAPDLETTPVHGIDATPGKPLLAVGADRLWIEREDGGGFEARFLARPEALAGLNAVRRDSDGQIWIGSDNGLWRLDSEGRDPRHFPPDPNDPTAFPARDVQNLMVDRTGMLWTTSLHDSVVRIIERAPGLERIAESFDGEPVTMNSIETADGRTWLATSSHGLLALDEDRSVRRPVVDGETGFSDPIWLLAQSMPHHLWVAGRDARLSRLDLRDKTIEEHDLAFARIRHSDSEPWDMLEDSSGRLWIATSNDGLHRYDPVSGEVAIWRAEDGEAHGLTSDQVVKLHKDDAGALWVGTDDQGVYVREPGRSDFRHIPEVVEGLSGAAVTSITHDPDGRIWVGLYPGGIARIATDGSVEQISAQDGLLDNEVGSLEVSDDGRAWIATVRGTVVMDTEDNIAVISRAKGLWDFTYIAEVHAMDPDGNPIFGGDPGALVIDSERALTDIEAPEVHVAAIRVDGELQYAGGGRIPGEDSRDLTRVELDHEDSLIEISLFQPDYRDLRHNEYRYRLAGDGEDWINLDAIRPRATFTHLDPGQHRVEFQARGPGGLWSEAHAQLELTVAPPPWRSPPAYAAYALAVMLLFGISAEAWRRRARREAILAREREQRRWVEQLHGMALEMAEPVDRETLLNRFLDRLMELLPLARARVALEGMERLPPIVLERGRARTAPSGDLAEEELELPLATPRRRLGQLEVRPDRARGFTDRDAAALRAVADQAAMALESALLMAEADSANRAKSAFLAKISHEIRTPLSGMLGLSRLMLDREHDEQRRGDLQTLGNSGRALMAILDDILDNARLESGRMELRYAPFDLVRAVEDTVTLHAPRAAEKGLLLACRVDGRLPGRVEGDEVRFRQVLGNLVSNAVKYTDTGSVTVEVLAAEDERLELVVEDTGPGLSDQARKHLFRPYGRDDSRAEEGTGLGLVICRELIGLMGGELRVDSSPRRGSRFAATIDAPPREGARVRPQASADVCLIGDAGHAGGVLRRHLEDWGITVHMGAPGTGGAEAVALLLDPEARPPGGMSSARIGPGAPGSVAGLSWPVREAALAECLDRLAGVVAGDAVADSGPADPARTAAHARLLVAEDNPVNARVVADMLAGAGYDTALVADGQAVLERITQEDFAAVLMDRYMPELDGLEATRQLREAGHSVPVIGLTAAATEPEREQCLAAGMDRVVIKDGDPRALLEALAEVIEGPHTNSRGKNGRQPA